VLRPSILTWTVPARACCGKLWVVEYWQH